MQGEVTTQTTNWTQIKGRMVDLDKKYKLTLHLSGEEYATFLNFILSRGYLTYNKDVAKFLDELIDIIDK